MHESMSRIFFFFSNFVLPLIVCVQFSTKTSTKEKRENVYRQHNTHIHTMMCKHCRVSNAWSLKINCWLAFVFVCIRIFFLFIFFPFHYISTRTRLPYFCSVSDICVCAAFAAWSETTLTQTKDPNNRKQWTTNEPSVDRNAKELQRSERRRKWRTIHNAIFQHMHASNRVGETIASPLKCINSYTNGVRYSYAPM